MANNYWIQIKASSASQNGWYQTATKSNISSISIKPSNLGNIYFSNTTPRDIWCQVGNRGSANITVTASQSIAKFADNTNAYDSGGSTGTITFAPNNDKWLGHKWLGVSTNHTWNISPTTNTIKWTFGLGYLVPTNETEITAAHAKALGEMVNCKKGGLSVTKGDPITLTSAYSGFTDATADNPIKNTTQTAVYNSLTNGTTRCGTLS